METDVAPDFGRKMREGLVGVGWEDRALFVPMEALAHSHRPRRAREETPTSPEQREQLEGPRRAREETRRLLSW